MPVSFIPSLPGNVADPLQGLEYGRECYCADTLSNGASLTSTSGQCVTACSGDASTTCGGPNALQVYTNGNFKGSSSGAYTNSGCVQEVDGRLLRGASIAADNMTIETCTSFCQSQGMKIAGLEYGKEVSLLSEYASWSPLILSVLLWKQLRLFSSPVRTVQHALCRQCLRELRWTQRPQHLHPRCLGLRVPVPFYPLIGFDVLCFLLYYISYTLRVSSPMNPLHPYIAGCQSMQFNLVTLCLRNLRPPKSLLSLS